MATRKKTPTKPEPVPVTTICSVCGLSWHDHGKDPTTDDCIRLLKEELAKKPVTLPEPYAVPVRPYRPWYWEEWYNKEPYPRKPYEITYMGASGKDTYSGFKEHTPRLSQANASPSL